MDAAQKLLRISALLTVIALLMAAPGWAQTLQAPSSVTIGNTGSAQAFVTSSAAGTTEITYTIATSYSNDTTSSGSWLVVTGGTVTPAALNFGLRNNTVAGIGSGAAATVTLTPTSPSGVAAVSITVTFNGSGSGGGGGSNVLTASPTSATFAGIGSQVSTNITLTTSSVNMINVTVSYTTSTGGSWLSAQFTNPSLSSTAGTTLVVYANTTGLTTGVTYQGNITVTPSTGTALSIPVNFTVGNGGSGSWSVNPTNVFLNFTTNSGFFPSQTVNVTPPSGASYYTISTSSTGNWLLPSTNTVVGSGATSFQLQISANANSLAAGQYPGTALLTDSNSNTFTISATLTVNGGNSSGLNMTPNPVTFNTAVNGAIQSQNVSVSSNSVGGTVTVSAVGTAPNWLTATGPNPVTVVAGQSSSFTVSANPSGLPAGNYSASIAVTLGTLSGTLTVNLVVGGGGGGGGGQTLVAPSALSFSYQLNSGVGNIAPQRLVITGPAGSWSSTISVASPSGGNWLKLSPNSGSSLPDPSVSGNAPIVSIDPTGLGVGAYNGTIAITTSTGGTQSVSVSLTVVSGGVLVPNPGSLIFSAQTGQANPGNQSIFFSASDGTVGPLAISAVSSSSRITLVSTGAAFLLVGADQTGLATGVYNSTITVTQNGAVNSPVTIPVVFVINGGGGGGGNGGNLTFSPSSISLNSVNGSTPSTTLTVSASTATSFSLGNIVYNNGSGWLTVSPSFGTTNTVLSVSANPSGLATGNYSATIPFNANGVSSNVGVTLVVSGSGGGGSGNVTVSPTALTFTAQQGASPAAQTVTVSSASGIAGISFTVQVTSGSNFLSTSAIANPATQYSFSASVNSSTLSAGSYSGNIRITPNGGNIVDIPVSLTVAAPAAVSATPTSLTFNYRAGDSAPASQPLTVSGGGAALAYTATASSSGNWLVVSPASGTTPGTVNASINTAGLAIGTYNGTIVVAGASGASGSTTVSVTLNVTAPLPTITKVTNAASYATGSIAPGEIITLFATDPAHPIGPATPVGLTLDSTGAVSTTIGGVQVLINGFACPMIYASASQVSAVVPYQLKLYTSATVLVKFLGQTSNGVGVNVATTTPGVFTANSSGTGPGAILNSNLTTNSPGNPATRGDVVVVYLTGEGETSPAGVTGKVTTTAAPPQPLTPAPLLPVSITVGGQGAQYTFAGEAPGFVSGVLQLNVVIPTNIAAGDQPIVVTIGGNPSQQGVTVSVK